MILHLSDTHFIDTDNPLDISIPLVHGKENLRAWYVDPPTMEPVRANGFTGSVKEGGTVNFRNIFFNPHGHGTHTECLGHITEEVYSVNQSLKSFMCKAQLVTFEPEEIMNERFSNVDQVITPALFSKINWERGIEAIVIRTLPNLNDKKSKDYSATNPAYLHIDCLQWFNELGIKHLLIDMPSVDRETDDGELVFHHGFWNVPDAPRFDRTITELIYVHDAIHDGVYILDLQVAPFENDASPSRPLLYQIVEK